MFPVITITQQFRVSISPIDRAGNAVGVEPGSVAWASGDPNVVEIVPNEENELEVLVVAKGTGVTNVSVSADADLGEGVKTISAVGEVAVIEGLAEGFSFVVGDVEEQPTPGPDPEPEPPAE